MLESCPKSEIIAQKIQGARDDENRFRKVLSDLAKSEAVRNSQNKEQSWPEAKNLGKLTYYLS